MINSDVMIFSAIDDIAFWVNHLIEFCNLLYNSALFLFVRHLDHKCSILFHQVHCKIVITTRDVSLVNVLQIQQIHG